MADVSQIQLESVLYNIKDAAARDEITALRAAVGSPLVAGTVAAMTNHDKIYVYTGSETGYSTGHWYYWNGSTWSDGGVYNETALETDTTLTVAGLAADAKAVGDALDELEDNIILSHKADVIYDTASGDIASFLDGADGLPVKDLTVGIEPVQDTSGGDPSPAHICPISGWTGCNIVNGSLPEMSWTLNKTINASGTIVDSASNGKYSSLIPYANTTVFDVLQAKNATCRIHGYDANGDWVEQLAVFGVTTSTSLGQHVITNTANESIKYIRISIGNASYVSLEYVGTIYPITFPSGTTVYGGTLDVTTGVLTVDRAYVDLGTLTWEKAAENTVFRTTLAGAKTGLPNTICDKRKMVYTQRFDLTSPYELAPYNAVSIYICSLVGEYTTAAAFKAAMSGCHVCYELASPTTVTLTPTEVTTLLGRNNIFADCGPVSIEYPADTKLYIQKINTPTDDDMIADAQIASGKYFIVNNNLYLSTTTILAGDPIKPGTNCTLTNLAAALNALNS